MIALIQRVVKAKVIIDNKQHSKINQGLVVFIGIHKNDTRDDAEYLCKKIINLRIFSDENKKMNISIKNKNASILVVSQFSLYGNCSKGSRPSFVNSANKKISQPLYKFFIRKLKEFNINIQSGKFGAMMDVELINNGPTTLIIESNHEKN